VNVERFSGQATPVPRFAAVDDAGFDVATGETVAIEAKAAAARLRWRACCCGSSN